MKGILLFCLVVNFVLTQTAISQNDEQLVWSDEFNGNSLDTAFWRLQTGAHGWGNNEWQSYTSEGNIRVEGGLLTIIAKKTGTGQKRGDYTSARLNSRRSFLYGRMEIRAKLPAHKGNGLWPAIWMLGENIRETGWPECGEIDIMEYVSYDPGVVHQTIHSTANNHIKQTQISTGPMALPDAEKTFHLYGIIWEEASLSLYLDSPEHIVLKVEKPVNADQSNWPFDKPFYFVLNMAVGGNWGGKYGVDDSIFPAEFEIDYVRVYKRL